MCDAPDIQPAPPPPAPPPVLEQVAPKKAESKSSVDRKRSGFSKYKIQKPTPAGKQTIGLGGISKKTGV